MRSIVLVFGAALFLSTFKWYVAFDHVGPVVQTLTVESRRVVLREARDLKLPPVPGSSAGYDCNNPVFRDGDTLYCFTSHEYPYRSSGPDLARLDPLPTRTVIDNQPTWTMGGRWIEAVHKVPGGHLYMWYHNEPPGVVPQYGKLTAPRIGQMVSDDNGLTWRDLGIILEANPETFAASTANQYFGGGHGDFSVVPDRKQDYFYFLFSTYARDVREQGVAVARLAAADLERPVGKVVKWCEGRWAEPGLGGRLTPIFTAEVDWHSRDARVLWGPAVHWNTYLNEYVVLMNQACGSAFDQAGIYIAFNARLDDPGSWTKPEKLLATTDWYPQVVGADASGQETDRVAGRVSRFFLKGRSNLTLEFE